ncbi:MAG: NUDIX domain-containing protein [Bacteroidales bacterium]|nr:NUDIX domain-containing protein [Bacteroidales bacterium]
MHIQVDILEKESLPDHKLTYVVMGARYNNIWVFVRHRERITWEMPAGHIEPGELPDEAAERELTEETGASRYTLRCLHDYAVTTNHGKAFGRLYLAEIEVMNPLPGYEIGERLFSDHLPASLTYPDVQRVLFAKVLEFKGS